MAVGLGIKLHDAVSLVSKRCTQGGWFSSPASVMSSDAYIHTYICAVHTYKHMYCTMDGTLGGFVSNPTLI